MRYERILAAVAATPWAIEPNKGRELAALLSRRVAGERATQAELDAVAAVRSERTNRKNKPRPACVTVIPLHGVMVQRADWIMEASGVLSNEQVGQLVDQAADDPAVEAIVMDVDSPGGQVYGTPELAAKVAAATKSKKVIAVCNSVAASGAYYVASQASELCVTPGGIVGSIGVVMFHCDDSEALKMQGQVVTCIASTEAKAGGHAPGPLSDVWKAQLESIVAGYYDMFVKAVASGRKVSQKTVKEDFGGGGVLLADAAVRVGMADKVASLDDVLARYGLSAADISPGVSASLELAPTAQHNLPDTETRKRRLQMD